MLSDRLAQELARTLVKQSSGGLTDQQVDSFLALYEQQVSTFEIPRTAITLCQASLIRIGCYCIIFKTDLHAFASAGSQHTPISGQVLVTGAGTLHAGH